MGLHGGNVRGGLYLNLNWILWSLDSGRIKYVTKSAREINLNSCSGVFRLSISQAVSRYVVTDRVTQRKVVEVI